MATKTASKNMGRPVINKHGVANRVWKKWSNKRKATFNKTMYALRPSMQWVYVGSETKVMKQAEWNILRWNIAFLLAGELEGK